MGYLHYAGFGVPKDYSRALRWWFKSAQQGYPGAENSLGVAYSLGEGVKRDEVKAVEWFLKAAEKGLRWSHFVGQFGSAVKVYAVV